MESKDGRVALVTGASSGIGLACARHLAARGLRVYGAARSAAAVEGFTLLRMDVTDPDSIDRAIARILEQEGRLDILVNNAGMGIAGPVEATSDQEAKQQLEVNFLGAVRMCRAVLPAMRRQGAGYIVNIGSINGLMATPFLSMYAASKFALEGMSEALRMELRPFGVRVVLVEPGDYKTAFTANRRVSPLTADTEPYRARMQNTLAKAAADEQNGPAPERVAQLVFRVVNQRNPRLRHSSGLLLQRAAIWLKRLGPYSLTEFVLRTYYGA